MGEEKNVTSREKSQNISVNSAYTFETAEKSSMKTGNEEINWEMSVR